MFRAASTECMDAELRVVRFALKVCRCAAGKESWSEPANSPAKLRLAFISIEIAM